MFSDRIMLKIKVNELKVKNEREKAYSKKDRIVKESSHAALSRQVTHMHLAEGPLGGSQAKIRKLGCIYFLRCDCGCGSGKRVRGQ